ncbi:MAG: calcium/sodium antiporter [Anaerovibrio sp.]|nr:calcium/sodium antiporter [Selenomonadaceae bacterium]MDY6054243.1 calcium/sodium antiporter [Anaerovibrio sp.]
MLMALGLLVLGFVLLVKGADWFVAGAADIARRLGIPQLIVGLTIVAMGTSMPEAAVSIAAALQGSADITVGNVLGSNIMNILIILGLTAVITRVEIQESTLRYEIPFMMVATVLLLVLGYTGYSITFVEGVVLWALFLLFLGYLFRSAKSGKGEDEADAEEKSEAMSVARCLLYMVVGGFLVVKGSDFAVMGASDIARFFGISERIIGLTIVALGTSLPELVTSVTAARRGDAGIAIGNIVGSNVFNILFVLSTTALIVDVPFAPAFMVDMGVAIASGVILWAGAYMYRGLNRTVGAVMLVAYGIYFVYLCL